MTNHISYAKDFQKTYQASDKEEDLVDHDFRVRDTRTGDVDDRSAISRRILGT